MCVSDGAKVAGIVGGALCVCPRPGSKLLILITLPDPLITERNLSLDGNAAFRKPANTGCGAPEGRSDLAEIFHLLGAQLLWDRSYAQTD